MEELQRLQVLEEVAKWNKHGRALYEFKEGDIFLLEDGMYIVLRNNEAEIEWLSENQLSVVGVCLANSVISTPTAEELIARQTE